MWIDIHAHLYDFSSDTVIELLDEALHAGVSVVVNTAVSIKTCETVIGQCDFHPGLRAAVGISPFDVVNQCSDWLQKLKRYTLDPHVIALGEIGLDSTNPAYPPLEQQLPFFEQQIDLAIESDLPAIVHSRGMEQRVASICKERGAKKVLFHCFTGGKDALEYLLECGYYVSISGIVTYKNSALADLVQSIPVNRLFIETDTPYLTPVPERGKTNRPALVHHTGEKISRILDMDREYLQKMIFDNFQTLFKKHL